MRTLAQPGGAGTRTAGLAPRRRPPLCRCARASLQPPSPPGPQAPRWTSARRTGWRSSCATGARQGARPRGPGGRAGAARRPPPPCGPALSVVPPVGSGGSPPPSSALLSPPNHPHRYPPLRPRRSWRSASWVRRAGAGAGARVAARPRARARAGRAAACRSGCAALRPHPPPTPPTPPRPAPCGPAPAAPRKGERQQLEELFDAVAQVGRGRGARRPRSRLKVCVRSVCVCRAGCRRSRSGAPSCATWRPRGGSSWRRCTWWGWGAGPDGAAQWIQRGKLLFLRVSSARPPARSCVVVVGARRDSAARDGAAAAGRAAGGGGAGQLGGRNLGGGPCSSYPTNSFADATGATAHHGAYTCSNRATRAPPCLHLGHATWVMCHARDGWMDARARDVQPPHGASGK